MPVDIEFAQPDRFEIRASGEVTLSEIERALEELLAHPDLPGADILADCCDVQAVPSVPELRVAAQDMKPVVERGLGAVCVVASDPLVYGTARMFSVFAEAVGADIGAAENMQDARAWLAKRRGRGRRTSAPET